MAQPRHNDLFWLTDHEFNHPLPARIASLGSGKYPARPDGRRRFQNLRIPPPLLQTDLRCARIRSYVSVLIPLGLLYVALLIIKIWGQKLCPPALVEELDAKVRLEAANKDVTRKETIDGYIDHAIHALNIRTCAITGGEPAHLCEGAVQEGLCEVLDPLIHTPQYIFDCNHSKFTITAIVQHAKRGSRGWERGVSALHFRDDLSITGFIGPNILIERDLRDSDLEIQHLIQTAFNDRRLIRGDILVAEKDVTIVCAPIPVVCEMENSNGVFLVAYDGCCDLPKDLEKVLLIFGRIVVNWLSKYDDCVNQKIQAEQLRMSAPAVPAVPRSAGANESPTDAKTQRAPGNATPSAASAEVGPKKEAIRG